MPQPGCIITEFGEVRIPDEECSWDDLMTAKTVSIERNRWIGERTCGVTILSQSYLWAVVDGVRCRVYGCPFYDYNNYQRNGFRPWLYRMVKKYSTRFLAGYFENLSVLM